MNHFILLYSYIIILNLLAYYSELPWKLVVLPCRCIAALRRYWCCHLNVAIMPFTEVKWANISTTMDIYNVSDKQIKLRDKIKNKLIKTLKLRKEEKLH